jgi:hypothetical protein
MLGVELQISRRLCAKWVNLHNELDLGKQTLNKAKIAPCDANTS